MSRKWLLALPGGLALALLTGPSPADDGEGKATLDRAEAKKAADYLNRVRKEPAKFGKETGADLSNVKPRPALTWNAALAKAAEAKALDMADRGYFDHVTPEGVGMNVQINEAGYTLPASWVKDKRLNFFESIAAGSNTGAAAIRGLVRDKGTAGAGHRKHLLGMSDFYAGCTDIGVGFARNPRSKYRSYICILVARKK